MHTHQIEEMIDVLIKEGLIPPSGKVEAVRALDSKYWNDRIAIVWTVDDVQSIARISKATARKVLQNVLENLDANTGVNWDVLRLHMILPLALSKSKGEASRGKPGDAAIGIS